MKKYILIISVIILCIYIIHGAYFRYIKQLWAYELHKTWNQFYELSQKEAELEIKYLTQAQEMYKNALDIWNREETQYNYDYVSELLKEKEKEKQQQEEETKQDEKQELNWEQQESQEQSWNGQSQWESWDDSSQASEQEQEDSQSWSWQTHVSKAWERWEEYNLWVSQKIGSLTDREEEFLNEVVEQLKQEQVYNQHYFGKKPQESNFDSLFDSFFWTIDRGNEKDW